ncbi:MAG: CdaR family protein [Geobacteraceae bacterium]
MSIRKKVIENLGLKGLALLLATILWLFVVSAQEGEIELMVPVKVENLSPSLTLAYGPPDMVDVRISGPRLFIMKVSSKRLVIPLDLRNIGAGTVLFSSLDKALKLPDGVRATRIHPSEIQLRIVKGY